MGTRSVEDDQGLTPTIAHAPKRIVHGLRPINARLEKVPLKRPRREIKLQMLKRASKI